MPMLDEVAVAVELVVDTEVACAMPVFDDLARASARHSSHVSPRCATLFAVQALHKTHLPEAAIDVCRKKRRAEANAAPEF